MIAGNVPELPITNHQLPSPDHAFKKEHRLQLFVEGVAHKLPFDLDRLTAALTRFLRENGMHKRVHVILVGDRYIADLNRRYRDVDGPTDVLAFDLGVSEHADDVEGEVYVSLDRAREQAEELEIPMAEEGVRLIVHGLLHLAGHDHEKGGKAEAQMKRETETGVEQVMKWM